MTTLHTTARLLATAAAFAVTTVLFTSVVSIAEPQRGKLMALNAEKHGLPAAAATKS